MLFQGFFFSSSWMIGINFFLSRLILVLSVLSVTLNISQIDTAITRKDLLATCFVRHFHVNEICGLYGPD